MQKSATSSRTFPDILEKLLAFVITNVVDTQCSKALLAPTTTHKLATEMSDDKANVSQLGFQVIKIQIGKKIAKCPAGR